MIGDLVYVEWHDHSIDGGWQSPDTVTLDPLLCKSVGWVVAEDARTLVLGATARHDDTEHALRQNIVKSAIFFRQELTVRHIAK